MNEYFRLYPERREQARETLAYFDCLNLASRVTAPMLIYAGLCDDVNTEYVAKTLAQRFVQHTCRHRDWGNLIDCGHGGVGLLHEGLPVFWRHLQTLEEALSFHLQGHRAVLE